MINYSIVMRSVNANLLEINQAKSRINQAKKEGTTPDPKDLELVKTEKQNAFAISQYTDIMTIEKFAKHITSHGSVYSRADISASLRGCGRHGQDDPTSFVFAIAYAVLFVSIVVTVCTIDRLSGAK